MLRCADFDLRERIRKYDLNVEDGAELDEQAFRNNLLEKVAAVRSEVRRLEVLLRGLRFDPFLKDPRKKVGRVYQHVVVSTASGRRGREDTAARRSGQEHGVPRASGAWTLLQLRPCRAHL